MKLGDLDAGLHPQRGIEVGERLVEQEHLRLAHDGAADGDALALAARKSFGRRLRSSTFEMQDLGGPHHLGIAFGLGHAGEAQRERHVVGHRHMRVERVGLEHHGEAARSRAARR